MYLVALFGCHGDVRIQMEIFIFLDETLGEVGGFVVVPVGTDDFVCGRSYSYLGVAYF